MLGGIIFQFQEGAEIHFFEGGGAIHALGPTDPPTESLPWDHSLGTVPRLKINNAIKVYFTSNSISPLNENTHSLLHIKYHAVCSTAK